MQNLGGNSALLILHRADVRFRSNSTPSRYHNRPVPSVQCCSLPVMGALRVNLGTRSSDKDHVISRLLSASPFGANFRPPTSNHFTSTLTMGDDDEFGLSSGDEAALAAACDEIEASNNSTKRKHVSENDHIEPPAKKQISISYPTKSPLGVKVLNEQFGLDQFRLVQEAVISRILEGGSAVVVFPTGGGKSLCYQVNSSPQYPEEYCEYDAAS